MAEENKNIEEQNKDIEPTIDAPNDDINILSDEEIGNLFNDLLSGKDIKPTSDEDKTPPVSSDEDSNNSNDIEDNIEPDDEPEGNNNEPNDDDDIDRDENDNQDTNNDEENIDNDEESEEKPIEDIQDKLKQDDEDSDSDNEEPTEEEVNQVIEEYNKLKEFYEKATQPIKLGDKEVAIDNPELIAQAQKAAIVLSRKYEKVKKYIPHIKVLEKYNLLEPEKLQLAADAINGKQEALLHLLKQNNINIEELDLEEVPEYKPNPELPSNLEIELEDLIDTADALGFGDKIKNELVESFDDNSIVEIAKHPSLKNELLQHIEVGIYDEIKRRIKQKEAIDFVGSYRSKPFLEKYREEASALEQELLKLAEEQKKKQEEQNKEEPTEDKNKTKRKSKKKKEEPKITEEMIKKEMEKIKKELEYKKKVEEKKNKISATNNMSKAPSQTSHRQKSIDELSDKEVEDIFNSLL